MHGGLPVQVQELNLPDQSRSNIRSMWGVADASITRGLGFTPEPLKSILAVEAGLRPPSY